jgi:2'-5' RNA ligase
LGEVELNGVHEIQRAVQQRVSGLSPFSTEVFGAGAFPTAARPRTIWLGVREGEQAMVDLHAAIEKALRPLGFRGEGRRFRPHMTLGRVRGGGEGIAELGQLVKQHAHFAAGTMTTSEIVLFSSRLESAGPVYEVMARIPLSTG